MGNYGYGGAKNINYYKVDRDEGVIVFDAPINYNIYLEYITNGLSLDEETKFPRRLFNALLAGVMYQLAVEDMSVPVNRMQMMKQNYDHQMLLLKSSERAFTKEEFLDTMYKNAKQSVKR